MQTFIVVALTFAAALCPGSPSFAQVIDQSEAHSEVSMSEALIREARESFNQAIEKQDIAAITSFFAPDYHIVTGRSDQTHGIENEERQLKEMFAADPSFVCHRTTREVRVNADWGLAEELGDWRCAYTAEGESIRSSGVYAAKWQRSNRGKWLLQSEVFTTLECRGSEKGCPPPDPIN